MNAAIGAINEHLKDIRLKFSETEPAFKKDKENTGLKRELSVTQLLMSFFPTTYTVRKCKIYSLDAESQNIDCVVLHPIHPRLETPERTIAVAEGVFAAIEVKPDISTLTGKSEFLRGLKQSESVKRLKRHVESVSVIQGGLSEYEKKIPFVMLAKNAQSMDKTLEFMVAAVDNQKIDASNLPDMVVVVDRYIIFHSMNIEYTLFCGAKKERSGECFILIDSADSTLGLFMLLLYSFRPPQPPLSEEFVLKKYLLGLTGVTHRVLEMSKRHKMHIRVFRH